MLPPPTMITYICAYPRTLDCVRDVLLRVVLRQTPFSICGEISDQAGGDRGGTERHEAELPVPVGPNGVVDPRNHVLDAEHVPRNLRRHNISVIALADRDEDVGILDPRAAQHVLIDAIADDALPLVLCAEPAERLTLKIDHRYRVTVLIHHARKRRAYAAAPENNDVHRALLLRVHSPFAGRPAPARIKYTP